VDDKETIKYRSRFTGKLSKLTIDLGESAGGYQADDDGEATRSLTPSCA
jgi:hypothetical protein